MREESGSSSAYEDLFLQGPKRPKMLNWRAFMNLTLGPVMAGACDSRCLYTLGIRWKPGHNPGASRLIKHIRHLSAKP